MKRDQIKLADLGISRELKTNQEDFTNTSVTNPSGTRHWIAPELYYRQRYDLKADIYPLGLVFVYTLTGGNQLMTFDQRDLKEPYSNDGVAIQLIKRLLNKNPDERPTAQQILSDNFFSN